MSAPATSAKVPSAAANGLGHFLGSNRLCADSVLGHARLNAEHLASPTGIIGLDQYCEVLEIAAARSKDINIGLRYGQQFKPQMLGLIGYLALSSPDMRSAADNLARYFCFHQQETVTTLTYRAPFYRLTYRITSPSIRERRQDAVVTLGMFCNVFRHAAGPDWCPEEVHLEHGQTEYWRETEQSFGAPVRFGQPINALVFRNEHVALPMPDADPQLFELLRLNLLQLGLERSRRPLIDDIRAIIRSRIEHGELDLAYVSDILAIPRWTLQRRLADSATSFAELVDRERRDKAVELLATRDLRIGQVAERLGYSEASAFSRAFSRWYGCSPAQYQRGAGR